MDEKIIRQWMALDIQDLETEIVDLRERIKELEEHEEETHRSLSAILGTDTSLLDGTQRLRDRIKELEGKNKILTRWDTELRSDLNKCEARVKELKEWIEKVLKWRNLDGDGISDPLRKELYKLIEKENERRERW
jgi:DNA repair exonuclease SbcCD ATPase subunit